MMSTVTDSDPDIDPPTPPTNCRRRPAAGPTEDDPPETRRRIDRLGLPRTSNGRPAVAASFYLVPALHAAALWRDELGFSARLDATWRQRLDDARDD